MVVEPSILIGDATCPRCGQLLWFIQFPETSRVFASHRSSTTRDRIIDIVANRFGIDRNQILNKLMFDDLAADSLDTAELVMELEETFDLP